MQFMVSRFWNASSAYGQLDGLEEVVELAKTAIRRLTGSAQDDDVVFTSGATESNAWAISEGARRVGTCAGGWVLTSKVEHPSIIDSIERLQEQGMEVRWVPVDRDGNFDLDKLERLLDSNLCFASLMLAHNETGVIQPLSKAIALIRRHSSHCLIHSDATQAIGKIPIACSEKLKELDLISFSGHKFHGPKGIGGLIIRNSVRLEPLIRGGGQQNDLRSGTLNIPAIAGVSKAAEISLQNIRNGECAEVQLVRDYFEERLLAYFPHSFTLGCRALRLPNTSFFGIPGADADDIVQVLAAEGVALSKGSSCSSQSLTPSYTALLMGYSYEEASSLIRFSSSPLTTIGEVDVLLSKLKYHLDH